MTKILVMGPPASGKTSIRYCFFKGLKPDEVLRKPPDPTYREEERFDHFDFLLRIIDLGGQENFMGAWSKGEKERELFSAVDALVFVVDAADPDHRNVLKAARILQRILVSLSKYSPEAKVHILLHKMDIVKTTDTTSQLKEELVRTIPTNMKDGKVEVAFHPTSIVDGTANRALRVIINEAMPVYGKISEAFEKAIAENSSIELIQLLALKKPEMSEAKGQALIVAQATTPKDKIAGSNSAVRVDFAPIARRLNEAARELGEGGVEYSLMKTESGRSIILKDLGEYYVIMVFNKASGEQPLLTIVGQVSLIVREISKLTGR